MYLHIIYMYIYICIGLCTTIFTIGISTICVYTDAMGQASLAAGPVSILAGVILVRPVHQPIRNGCIHAYVDPRTI